MNENLENWLKDIESHEPEVGKVLRKKLEESPEGSPIIMWLKARRFVHGHQHQAAGEFSSTKFNGIKN